MWLSQSSVLIGGGSPAGNSRGTSVLHAIEASSEAVRVTEPRTQKRPATSASRCRASIQCGRIAYTSCSYQNIASAFDSSASAYTL